MQSIETLSEPQVHEMLERGATLVTVNRRLAGYVMDRYGRKMVDAGHGAWETPDILPYGAWLERCLDESRINGGSGTGKDAPLLLHPLQERILWEQVIESDASREILFRSGQVARIAVAAMRLCIEWRVPIDSGLMWSSGDPAAFAAWAREFENRLTAGNQMVRARLPDAVQKAVLAGRLPMAAAIFSGFDDFPPQMKELIAALASKGVKTFLQAFPSRAGRALKAAFADDITELQAAAKWVRAKLAERPGSRIGVIVGDLPKHRETVCRVFEETLRPSSMVSLSPGEPPVFNISLGKPLSSYPLIKSALLILEMVRDNPEMSTVSALLLSPFIQGAGHELSLRAMADGRLRKRKQPRMPVGQIFRHLEKKAGRGGGGGYICPIWCRNLKVFEQICLEIPEIQTASAWCETFSNLLHTFGWPGDKTLDSGEFQTHAAWQDALVGFAAAGAVYSGMSFSRAEHILKSLLEEILFQPETEDVPLQVMGLLEAAGEEFDAAWVTGLTSDEWPRPSAPNPFIPMSLQRRHGLPRATADRELDFARAVTRRLMASADDVVVSFPRIVGDTPLFPSALVDHLPEWPPVCERDQETGDEPEDYRLKLSASGDLEDFSDLAGPPLEKGQTLAGGTGVIKAQAACPFSAFVQYRLGARPLEFPVSGIDAADRGILVHKALELVWQHLKNHSNLTAEKSDALAAIVAGAASKAVSAMSRERPQTFTGRFAALEKQRLEGLVMQWLKQDAARAPFEVVATEWRLSVEIGDIRLSAFADRIDHLQNGRAVIIDYKTGAVKESDWFADRMAEPQLPLYCTALESPPAGVFFARVKKGDMKYVGIADEASVVAGIHAVADTGGLNERFGSMAEIVNHWESHLEALAGELAEGHAPVSPVSVHTSCRYCHFKPVCRINELVERGLVTAP